MSKIIGICGLAGSGKNTVADYICEKYENWQQLAFADSLKSAVANIFGWPLELVMGTDAEMRKKREEVDKFWAKELNIQDFTPRKALQLIGTDVFRDHFNKDFWTICMKRKILKNVGHTVITDVRFPNELKMIRDMGGFVVQVIRGELPDWYREAEEINQRCIQQPFLPRENLIARSSKLSSIHPSEYSLAGMINPDYVIHNDGSLDDLNKNVDDMMKTLYEKY